MPLLLEMDRNYISTMMALCNYHSVAGRRHTCRQSPHLYQVFSGHGRPTAFEKCRDGAATQKRNMVGIGRCLTDIARYRHGQRETTAQRKCASMLKSTKRTSDHATRGNDPDLPTVRTSRKFKCPMVVVVIILTPC